TMRHGPSGCQGVPDRPEFREAATTLRAQCETLDQPAALAAYLNQRKRAQNQSKLAHSPLMQNEAGLTKPTAHPRLHPIVPKFGCLSRWSGCHAASGGFVSQCSWQAWMRWSMNLS